MVRSGIRGTIGTWGWDVDEGPFRGTVAEVIDRQRRVLDAFPPGERVAGWVTLVGHDLMSDELLVAASRLALDRGTGLTFHQSPTDADATAWLAQSGRRPLVHFAELGALGRHVLVAHALHIDDDELEVLLDTGTAVAYCPWAYLRLGQGVTRAGRHADLVERGGRVALGCDSENASDQIDILRTAALAAGLAKDVRGDPTRFGAREAFALATIDGAEAIGMADRIGSLEVGKCADLVVHDTSAPSFLPPGGDPYLQLVWGTDGRSVRHVVVEGEVVVRDRRCVLVDEEALAATAREHAVLLRAAVAPSGPAGP
jgi:5-methylthioadenosine/S-adenosylhomocysteine deaminase